MSIRVTLTIGDIFAIIMANDTVREGSDLQSEAMNNTR